MPSEFDLNIRYLRIKPDPLLMQAFYLTPAAEKTKTQEKNSSQELKKKLNLWEDFPSKLEKSRKKLKFLLKTKNI